MVAEQDRSCLHIEIDATSDGRPMRRLQKWQSGSEMRRSSKYMFRDEHLDPVRSDGY